MSSTAIVANAPSLADTRASISKYFPMGSIMGSGKNSPISLHSVHPLLFAAVWSLIGETLVAQGFLARPVCEKIAKQVSMSNRCPICVTAHAMMEAAATKAAKDERDRRRREQRQRKKNGGSVEESSNASSGNATGSGSTTNASKDDEDSIREALEAEAIEYSKIIHKATQVSMIVVEDENGTDNSPTDSVAASAPSSLDDRAKAEVAIVVFLFEHMNRVVSVIMGETMSTAMFGVPEKIAAPMESPSFMAKMNNWIMGPFLKGYFRKDRTPKSGFTSKLFDAEGANQEYVLPTHLQGAKDAGPGRSQAVARWTAVVDAMEKEEPISTLVGDNGLSQIATIREDLKKACLRSRTATAHLAECVKDVEDKKQRAALLVILLTTCVPGLANKSLEWKEAKKVLGDETARLLVVWWSMKLSVEQAKGLE